MKGAMTDVFHRAARDGYLDILREATRKDADRADEDGMTPTLWAAYHGNLDALRMLVGRGGNPDKSDYLGNTAMHCAAACGHLNCVSFLVSFGTNLWALDNDYHTPLDIAALNNHTAIVQYLDSAVAKQTALNHKVVMKMKKKAVLDAQKQIKKYQKLQEKAARRAESEDKRLARERERMESTGTLSSSSSSGGGSTIRSRISVPTGTISRGTEPKPYSAHFPTVGKSTGKLGLTGVAKKIKQKKTHTQDVNGSEFKIGEMEMDGKRTVRSLSGLQRDHHVMYMRNGGDPNGEPKSPSGTWSKTNGFKHRNGRSEDTISRTLSEPDFMYYSDPGLDGSLDSESPEPASMFERPGFGSVAFMNRPMTSDALLSLPSDSTDEDIQNGSSPRFNGRRGRRRGSFSDSIGTVGSLATRMQHLPWDDQELESLDDEEINESSTLELFLAAHGLTDFISIFTKEKIDLDTLLLLTDTDLKEIGLPMGPRRKLIDAIARRKQVMKNPGIIMDSLL